VVKIKPDIKLALKSHQIVVHADKERIAQVLSNLLDNAIKFTNFGTITVSVNLDVNKIVKISVRDSGNGIDPEIRPKLFHKFTTLSDRGTGLGLFISKNIVEAHGGSISGKNNKPGTGATFSFTLPTLTKMKDTSRKK
jgi:signal transduction histidine kinase